MVPKSRPTYPTPLAATHSVPITRHAVGNWPLGDLRSERSLLDEEFDDMGCETPMLLRLANQV
jgi:hypothetical protein